MLNEVFPALTHSHISYSAFQFMEVGDCVEKLVVFTKREKIQHFAQSILHVQTALLICQCKCLPYPNIVTWPSKNEKDVLSEATRTYGNAMSLLKQVRSKATQYNLILKQEDTGVLLVYLLFLEETARNLAHYNIANNVKQGKRCLFTKKMLLNLGNSNETTCIVGKQKPLKW
jgi:hypothetical protein